MSARGVSLIGEQLRRARGKGDFVLDVEHVEVAAGETFAILGPSGSGKTTLLETLGLLERPDSGRVLVDGRPADRSDRDARLQMAAVFQRPYLFRGSVEQNVEYGLVSRGVTKLERDRRVADALQRVGLAGFQKRGIMALSGGEAQRVSLARALVLEPRVLLLDEPLASLDRPLRRRLTRDFATILRQSGVTVVYVTHDQDEAFVVADRMAIMKAGRIVACGPSDELAGIAEDEWTAEFLGVEPALRGTVASCAEGLFTVVADGFSLVAAGNVDAGSLVAVAVRPEDVLLFESGVELPPTSARNRLEATVVELEPHGATLRATLQAGTARLAASVSRAAATELKLRVGIGVLAVFKASAVRWRLVPDGDARAI